MSEPKYTEEEWIEILRKYIDVDMTYRRTLIPREIEGSINNLKKAGLVKKTPLEEAKEEWEKEMTRPSVTSEAEQTKRIARNYITLLKKERE